MLKKLKAFLIALMFLVAVEPDVMAMPMTLVLSTPCVTTCTALPAVTSHKTMPCSRQMTPCHGLKVCSGLLNCFAPGIVPTGAVILLPVTIATTKLWLIQAPKFGLTPRPDNPPPIL